MSDQNDLQAILAAKFELEMAVRRTNLRSVCGTKVWLTPCSQLGTAQCTFLEAIKYVYADYRRDRLAKERPENQRRT